MNDVEAFVWGRNDHDARDLDQLHALMLSTDHRCHQRVAKVLQGIANETTVPVVVDVVNRGFDAFAYTRSEPGVIAKWFSWILFAIRTPRARDALRLLATSAPDVDVRREMASRLAKWPMG
jgi:putative aminopeptidase FrvX